MTRELFCRSRSFEPQRPRVPGEVRVVTLRELPGNYAQIFTTGVSTTGEILNSSMGISVRAAAELRDLLSDLLSEFLATRQENVRKRRSR